MNHCKTSKTTTKARAASAPLLMTSSLVGHTTALGMPPTVQKRAPDTAIARLCPRPAPRSSTVARQTNPRVLTAPATEDEIQECYKRMCTAPVSTCEIKEHLRFLRAVHVASSRGKGNGRAP